MTLTAAPDPPFATGLKAPIGLAEDPAGNLWVTEAAGPYRETERNKLIINEQTQP